MPTTERVAEPGTVAGLVWTEAGGRVQYIECLCVGTAKPGQQGALTLTGARATPARRLRLALARHASAECLPARSPACLTNRLV